MVPAMKPLSNVLYLPFLVYVSRLAVGICVSETAKVFPIKTLTSDEIANYVKVNYLIIYPSLLCLYAYYLMYKVLHIVSKR